MQSSKFDIRLSHEDYMDILDIVFDDRLSRSGVFRFKNLAEVEAIAVPSTAIFCMPIAYGFAKLFTSR